MCARPVVDFSDRRRRLASPMASTKGNATGAASEGRRASDSFHSQLGITARSRPPPRSADRSRALPARLVRLVRPSLRALLRQGPLS